MRIGMCRFIALMLAALNMGMTWAHVLELPAKMRYDAQQWTSIQQTLSPRMRHRGPTLVDRTRLRHCRGVVGVLGQKAGRHFV
jgi:hypothetical protein